MLWEEWPEKIKMKMDLFIRVTTNREPHNSDLDITMSGCVVGS